DDLLDVSRITRGKVELRREQVELASVVASALETSRPLVEGCGHALEVSLPEEPIHLLADPTRLAQVLANLLNTAAKFTAPGGRITLTAGREGDEVVVRVRDTGIGIAPVMLPHIFEMFTQVKSTPQRAQGGLGVGLTLVQRLVEMHGGTVTAHSEGLGRGSEFEVRLPVSAVGPENGVTARAAVDSASAAPTRRVMVVDDNADVADSLATLLRLEGQDVRVALDGPAALAAAQAERPDVVLLDIGMPGMNGFEVCRRLRRLPGMESVTVVAVTGWG